MENKATPTVVPEPSRTVSEKRGLPSSRSSFVFSILAVAFVVLVPIARSAWEEIDRQIANFGGLACGLLALLFAQLAVATHRRVPRFLKIAVFAAPVVAVLGFLANYEFAGFSGEVWPTFRARGSAGRPKDNFVVGSSSSDEQTIDPAIRLFRFSQFLGNRRDGTVDSPEFAMDWAQRSPKVAWRREIGEGWSGFAVANGLAFTLFQRGESEVLSAWYLETGRTAWEHEIPGRHSNPLGGTGPRSTPTVASRSTGEVVIAPTARGIFVCLDCETGVPRWELNLLPRAGINQIESEQNVMWGRSGSPLVVDDMAIIPFGGSKSNSSTIHSLISVDLATGEDRWLGGQTQISYASPALLTIEGERQIVSVNEGNITGHNVATGKVLWESSWPSKSNGDACASQPVQVDNNKILIGKGYGLGSKLIELRRNRKSDVEDNSVWEALDVWSNTRMLKTKFTSAVMFEGKAYALSDGILECVDPMTGARLWRGPRYGQGQLLIVNGEILVSAEDGRIASVNRSNGKPVLEVKVLEGITWNTPAVAGPFLLVRNGTEAVCLKSSAGD
ncbi:MAG: PQQ-binding-like beta-propeller repeat protein [Planctomycetota bacterium]